MAFVASIGRSGIIVIAVAKRRLVASECSLLLMPSAIAAVAIAKSAYSTGSQSLSLSLSAVS